MLEWIAYHRVLGIDTFLLADNGGPDNTSQLLKELEKAAVILRFDWLGQTQFQLPFYRQALRSARPFVDGLFFIDVDEFLRPEQNLIGGLETATPTSLSGRTVATIAQQWLSDPNIGAVALNWATYGSSGHSEPGDGLVIERFSRRAPQEFSVNRHAKAFVRVASCAGPADNPHAVVLRTGRYVDPKGEEVVWDTSHGHRSGITKKVIWDVLRVDHFVVKSRKEFAAKQARGSLYPTQTNWDQYFASHDRNDVDDPIPFEIIDRTKKEMAEIVSRLGLPSLATR